MRLIFKLIVKSETFLVGKLVLGEARLWTLFRQEVCAVTQVPLKRRCNRRDATSTGSRWFQPRTGDFADARSNVRTPEETAGTIFKPRFTVGPAMNDRVNHLQFIHRGNTETVSDTQPFLAIT